MRSLPTSGATSSATISLTPGFSPVNRGAEIENRFNGFPHAGKPLKRLASRADFDTRLKPGVNEIKALNGSSPCNLVRPIAHRKAVSSLRSATAVQKSLIRGGVFLIAFAFVRVLVAGPSPGAGLPEILFLEDKPPLVGVESRLEIALPEAGLTARTPERMSSVHLRINLTKPHGNLHFYDLRYIGRVPGDFDLRDFLLTANGLPATNLPPLPISVSGILPAQHNGWLEEQKASEPSLAGGYKKLAILAVALWVLALLVLFRFGRKEKSEVVVAPVERPLTFAERLRPLLERAAAGKLSADEKALLERMLITHWQGRLGLHGKGGDEVIAHLRKHAEAGELLRALEDWLHRPPGSATVSVEAVLKPYHNLPAEEPLAEVAR
jgi:hypothetical protein